MRKHRRKPRRVNGHGTRDRLGFYRAGELAHAQIAAVEISDPYGTPSDATARPEPGLRRDGTLAEGELEWRAPEAPRLVVVRASAVRSADLARPVMDKGRRTVDPFDDRQLTRSAVPRDRRNARGAAGSRCAHARACGAAEWPLDRRRVGPAGPRQETS
jgi:hypothetical protein